MPHSVSSDETNAHQLLVPAVPPDTQVQALLATSLKRASRPPSIAATSPPDQDIPLDKLKFDVDVDPRRVLSYMYNVTSYFKKCVRECTYGCPLLLTPPPRADFHHFSLLTGRPV